MQHDLGEYKYWGRLYKLYYCDDNKRFTVDTNDQSWTKTMGYNVLLAKFSDFYHTKKQYGVVTALATLEFYEHVFIVAFMRWTETPVRIIDEDGDEVWKVCGKLHRKDGPAIICTNGAKIWIQNNEFHREDGPAIEHANGSKEWWLNDKKMTAEEHAEKTSKSLH